MFLQRFIDADEYSHTYFLGFKVTRWCRSPPPRVAARPLFLFPFHFPLLTSNNLQFTFFTQILSNDPKQFLRHYYHFVAEFFFGVQAFWRGFFSPDPLDNGGSHFSFIHPLPPPINRIIFGYS
jgi:hypothetical protein